MLRSFHVRRMAPLHPPGYTRAASLARCGPFLSGCGKSIVLSLSAMTCLFRPRPARVILAYRTAWQTNTASRTYAYARFPDAPAIVFDAPRRGQLLRAGPPCAARGCPPERAGPRAGRRSRAGAGRYSLRPGGDQRAAAHRSDRRDCAGRSRAAGDRPSRACARFAAGGWPTFRRTSCAAPSWTR